LIHALEQNYTDLVCGMNLELMTGILSTDVGHGRRDGLGPLYDWSHGEERSFHLVLEGGRPLLVEVDDRACGRDLMDEPERALDDPALLLDGTGHAEVVAHREVHEQRAWRSDLNGQVPPGRHDHGRDAG
jgi:hypothetical protein